MKNYYRILRHEDGAELIEAAFIYPFVLLVLTGLIYMGLFILQNVTVSAYAQKVALLSAREVAYPGYIKLIDRDRLTSSAIEIALDDYSKAASGDDKNAQNGTVISFPMAAKEVNARIYRYLFPNPLKPTLTEKLTPKDSKQYDSGSFLEEILEEMVNQNSLLLGKNPAEVTITCNNYLVAQYVTVTVDQDLINNQLLTALGVKNPSVHVSVMAAANDTDEFVRNTNFVCDALEMIAKKLGIDVYAIYDKFNGMKKTLGLE